MSWCRADDLTFGQYLAKWLAASVKGTVMEIAREAYDQQVRVHIAPALGRVKLAKLTPGHLQGFYQERLDVGLKPASVRFMYAAVHRALKQAHRWRLVRENVAAATDPPKPQAAEIRPLDAQQAKRLLDAARGYDLEALFIIAVTAGLRIGELSGLRWADVDLERKSMRVTRILSRAKNGPRFTTPNPARVATSG